VSSLTSNQNIPNVALVTVAIDPAISSQIFQAVSKMLWAVHRADCEGYISAEKRPPFSQAVKSSTVCVGIINFDTDLKQAIESAAYLQEMYPGKTALIAYSSSKDHEVLLQVMRSGCNDFMGTEFNEAAFAETLARINAQWSAKAAHSTTVGSVLTFFGAKGGVGTTTLAVHIAMYLVQCHQKKTLLIDNHPQLGHACIYLGIDGSRYNFHELVRNLSRLDSELLRGYIATHASGLEVLSSPDLCGGRKAMDPESMAQTLDFLRSEYDYVIVDCPNALDETNLAVIDASNRVFVIATPEIGAVRDLSRHVDILSQNDSNAEKIKVVINRFSAQHAVSVEQIEKAIRLPISFKLPNCYAEVTRAGILGEPIGHKSKSEFANQLLKWSNNLAGSAPIPTQMDEPAAKKAKFSLWK
jgi:pilus assembly protein CpaE